MIERLYGTRVDPRTPASCIRIRAIMGSAFGKPIRHILDVTDNESLIFLVTCTAEAYDNFKKLCAEYTAYSEWIDFDCLSTTNMSLE